MPFSCHSFATELDVDHAAWIVESNRPRMLSSLFSKVIRLLGTHESESSATGHASPFAGGRGKKPKMVTLPWLAVFISTYSLLDHGALDSLPTSKPRSGKPWRLPGRAGVRKIAERFGVNASTVQRISAGM